MDPGPQRNSESQIQEIAGDEDLNNQIHDNVKNEDEADPPISSSSSDVPTSEITIPEVLDRIRGKKCIGFGCKQILNMTNGQLLRHLTNHFRYVHMQLYLYSSNSGFIFHWNDLQDQEKWK